MTSTTVDDVRWPVRTPRLALRTARPEDADATWRNRSLPSVAQWLTELPTDIAACRATFADPAPLAATVIVECDGRLLGDFMLRVEDAWAQAEVAERARNRQAERGWVLDPAFAGQGYASEAVRALVDLCFGVLDLRRVVADCFLDNGASWRLMERVGMRRELYTVAESLHRDGRWLDTVGYAIPAEEADRH